MAAKTRRHRGRPSAPGRERPVEHSDPTTDRERGRRTSQQPDPRLRVEVVQDERQHDAVVVPADVRVEDVALDQRRRWSPTTGALQRGRHPVNGDDRGPGVEEENCRLAGPGAEVEDVMPVLDLRGRRPAADAHAGFPRTTRTAPRSGRRSDGRATGRAWLQNPGLLRSVNSPST